MPDETPVPEPSLADRLNAMYAAARAGDVTIRRLERDIHKQRAAERLARQLCSVAKAGIRVCEVGIMRECARELSEEIGTRILRSPQANIYDYRRAMEVKLKAAQDAAQVALDPNVTPHPPTPPPQWPPSA